MPPSSILPETSYSYFYTDQSFTTVAKTLGICRPTLRRWWLARFGEASFEERNSRTHSVLSSEEKEARRAAYRRVNQDKLSAQKREWNKKHTKSLVDAKRKLRSENREAYNAYNRLYYAKNKDKILAKRNLGTTKSKHQRWEKDYYSRHPETLMYKNAKKRAKSSGLPFSITLKDILACVPLDGCCPITQLPFERGVGKVGPQSMTLDRVIPSLGYTPANIRVISHLANTIKQNCTDPEIFRRVATYLESAMVRSI